MTWGAIGAAAIGVGGQLLTGHGGSGSGTQVDMQQLQQQQQPLTDLASNLQNMTSSYYTNYLQPQVKNTIGSVQQGQQAISAAQQPLSQMAQGQAEQYMAQGLPAQAAYYKAAQDFSTPAYAEQQAGVALGDQRVADANQAAQLQRQMGAMGISSTSPAALMARSNMGIQNAAAEAAAQTRARQAATALGLQLKQGAAQFGAQAGQLAWQAGLSSGQLATSGAMLPMYGLGATTSALQPQLQAGQIAGNALGQNLDAYTRLTGGAAAQAAQTSRQSSAGFGAGLQGLTSALGPAIGSVAGGSGSGGFNYGAANNLISQNPSAVQNTFGNTPLPQPKGLG
jgi:hypothetical protein